VAFAARYYQRSIGEIALAALPPQLRDLTTTQLARRLKRKTTAGPVAETAEAPNLIALSAEQTAALARIEAETGTFLLVGSTGSGKTEVYLRCVADLLARDPEAQALVMVPEINLTPQLEARFKARFGDEAVVSLHSGMTNPQRLASWLAAHGGAARIVLGTRMAVFASIPGLKLIVVDEEHDPSYKQQEGARYSARDLAVWRGQREGQGDPGLGHALARKLAPEPPRRRRRPGRALCAPGHALAHRRRRAARGAAGRHEPAAAEDGDLGRAARRHRPAHRARRAEHDLLNRRGYAPVLACGDCGWKSECPHCSAYRVFHKIDRTLRCHHCGFAERVPRACPACGNPDIAPVGRGTERLEEHLAELFAAVKRPDGSAVRIARIDADSTKKQGALESQLAAVHAGEVDVLVGTQMIAKGHDFRRITLVAAVNPDGALFSSDFRAPERLFSLLMQSAGRAGRDAAYLAAQGATAEMWIQTHHAQHPLFMALRKHDYTAFAQQQLDERRAAAMPPFAFQALLRADAREQAVAQAFLNIAADARSTAGRRHRHALSRGAARDPARGQRGARADADRKPLARRAAAAAGGLAAAAARTAPHARGQGRDPLAGRRRSAQHLSRLSCKAARGGAKVPGHEHFHGPHRPPRGLRHPSSVGSLDADAHRVAGAAAGACRHDGAAGALRAKLQSLAPQLARNAFKPTAGARIE
jgi:primosomal protein N' (replication factor Y)